ncbi:hypothetical protein [Bacillus wiedmannii]|uniref:hypothetical protein n=1 Tax=Bacillus wiedmannii TaxID=1890302 RepID=UPI0015CF5D4F|nr:hypothetical protein [Bacillus wiedmannii]
MEFLIELLREVAKGAMRELSAYVFKKQFLDKNNKKTAPKASKRKGGSRKKN